MKTFLVPSDLSFPAPEYENPIAASEFSGFKSRLAAVVVVVLIEDKKRKMGTGNPYPKRGQIKKRIFGCVGDWIVSNASSTVTEASPLAEFGGGKGNPYPKRGGIKVRIFNEWFQ